MKVNLLEAHDRLIHFKKQSDYISQGCNDCIRNRPEEFGSHPFYIWAHKREIGMDERMAIFNKDLMVNFTNEKRKYKRIEDVPTHRHIWMPRLTKPRADENSMLFKYYPKLDQVKIIWILPERHTWDQFVKNNLTEQAVVCESIHAFKNNLKNLEAPEADDMSEMNAKQIYLQIAANAKQKEMMNRLYSTGNNS